MRKGKISFPESSYWIDNEALYKIMIRYMGRHYLHFRYCGESKGTMFREFLS